MYMSHLFDVRSTVIEGQASLVDDLSRLIHLSKDFQWRAGPTHSQAQKFRWRMSMLPSQLLERTRQMSPPALPPGLVGLFLEETESFGHKCAPGRIRGSSTSKYWMKTGSVRTTLSAKSLRLMPDLVSGRVRRIGPAPPCLTKWLPWTRQSSPVRNKAWKATMITQSLRSRLCSAAPATAVANKAGKGGARSWSSILVQPFMRRDDPGVFLRTAGKKWAMADVCAPPMPRKAREGCHPPPRVSLRSSSHPHQKKTFEPTLAVQACFLHSGAFSVVETHLRAVDANAPLLFATFWQGSSGARSSCITRASPPYPLQNPMQSILALTLKVSDPAQTGMQRKKEALQQKPRSSGPAQCRNWTLLVSPHDPGLCRIALAIVPASK